MDKKIIIDNIVRRTVPTSGNIVAILKVGRCKYGDGSSGGFGINEFRSPSKKHSEDALIATTSPKHADILVTEDIRFQNRMKSHSSRCKIWGVNEFSRYVD